MDTTTKIAIAGICFCMFILGYFTSIHEAGADTQQPIEVHYKDVPAMADADAPPKNINVICPRAVVSVKLIAHKGRQFTDADKEELTNIICSTLEK